ncbi:MAG: hypothetical protein V2B18_18270 [Pseudomonadota bacterium]
MEMHPFWMLIDPYLIWSYRLTGYALVDFMIGTFVLAWISLFVGELTIASVFLLVRDRIDAATSEAGRYQDLSAEAMAAGDKEAYSAANELANDAFGRSFFMQIALSSAFLWPVFVALAWMGHRFSDLEFPLLFTGASLGFIGMFIVLYAAAHLMFKRIKHKLPYFNRIKTVLDSYERTDRRTGETA